jgi:hypothetical protein
VHQAPRSNYLAAEHFDDGLVTEAHAGHRHLAGKGATQRSAPAVVRMISGIASRFGVVVSEEAAAKAVPVVGMAAGAIVNVLFMDHFQNMARGHFIVKRLEDKYGTGAVESAYLHIK